jgi:NOL1/NOP2/fmu family ribosome biogenesis protein
MKAYRIKAANAAGRWSYVGIFAHSVDAVMHAVELGATRASAKPIKPAA